VKRKTRARPARQTGSGSGSAEKLNNFLTLKIMSTPTLWKINCMEKEYPGIWGLWFKKQCVTDGHSPEKQCRLEGGKKSHDWIVTRKALQKIRLGDLILVALPGCRIGRIGRVLELKILDDDWHALYPGEPGGWKNGYMGRRISVQWELDRGAPDSPNQVVQLPDGVNLGRGTLRLVKHHKVEWFRQVIANPANWVDMVGVFGYERSLSDYIAVYPHILKDGLEPYPGEDVRERVFGDDRSRADVLLRDGDGKPVIVECKQGSPTVGNIRQLRGYIKNAEKQICKGARGILVHGGARTVDEQVWRETEKSPRVQIEFFHYKLDVEFTPSCRVTGG